MRQAVRAATERMIAAQPLLGTLAADPSLRGVGRTLELVAEGLARGEGDREVLGPALAALAGSAEAAVGDRLVPLDWARLFTGQAPDPLALRRFILVKPVPDYGALAPVSAAVDAVRAEAARPRPDGGERGARPPYRRPGDGGRGISPPSSAAPSSRTSCRWWRSASCSGSACAPAG
ncbi:hypothetical protein [Dankookia sp. P2]|uniref:hypothetical protein n=1 Tax=Dankookia sp. P2 TaxID=3423955 RepID=UPI003D664F75